MRSCQCIACDVVRSLLAIRKVSALPEYSAFEDGVCQSEEGFQADGDQL